MNTGNGYIPSMDMSENPIDISRIKEYRYNIDTQHLDRVTITSINIPYDRRI